MRYVEFVLSYDLFRASDSSEYFFLNVVKISNDAFRSPLAKLKENLTLGDLMTEQFKQANEGVDTIRKQYETIGNATLPHYKVI